MRTESQYNGMNSRTLAYSGINKACAFKETHLAWITGGGGSTIDEFNLITETIIQQIGGWSTTNQWAMSHENEAYIYWENDSRLWTFATRTARGSPSGQPSNHHQQKSVQSKLGFGWAGNEG